MNTLRFLGTRSLFVFMLIFVAANVLIDYGAIERAATFKQWHRNFAPHVRELLMPQVKGSAYLSSCIRYYEAFVVYVPNGKYANDLLGFCYARDGQYDKALGAYQKMAALKPKIFWYSFNLGLLNVFVKNYLPAEEWLKKARQQPMEETMVYLQQQQGIYGSLLGAIGEGSRLQERYLQARYHTYQLLVLINARVNDYEDMLGMAQEAIAQGLDAQGKFSFYAELAAFKMGRHQDALKFFDTCIDKEFLPAQVNYYRAQSLEELGRMDDALLLRDNAVAYNEDEMRHYLECYPAQPQLF